MELRKNSWLNLNGFTHIVVFIFLGTALVDSILHWRFTSQQEVMWHFISNIVFLNSIHVAYTFSILLLSQPGRAWIKARREKDPMLLFKWIGLFAFFFGMQWWIVDRVEILNKLFLIFIFAYGANHSLRQHLGLSLLYNRKVKNLSNREAILRSEKWERALIHTLVGLITVRLILLVGLQPAFDTYRFHINMAFFIVGALAVSSFLFYLSKGFHQFHPKILFLARLFFYPLGFLSFLGIAGYQSVHGLEYLQVRNHFLKKDAQNERRIKLLSLALNLFIMGCALMSARGGLVGLVYGDSLGYGFWMKLFSTSMLAFSLLHYVIDGEVFKMRHEETRQNILPTLKELNSLSEEEKSKLDQGARESEVA